MSLAVFVEEVQSKAVQTRMSLKRRLEMMHTILHADKQPLDYLPFTYYVSIYLYSL